MTLEIATTINILAFNQYKLWHGCCIPRGNRTLFIGVTAMFPTLYRTQNLNPLRQFESLFEDLTGQLDKGLHSYGLSSMKDVSQANFAPHLDVEEYDNEYEVAVELPGVPRDEISVSVHDDSKLVIKGEKKREIEAKNGHVRERFYGAFHREILLPDNINKDNIEVKHRDGVLKVVLPKKEEQKPESRKLEIKDG